MMPGSARFTAEDTSLVEAVDALNTESSTPSWPSTFMNELPALSTTVMSATSERRMSPTSSRESSSRLSS